MIKFTVAFILLASGLYAESASSSAPNPPEQRVCKVKKTINPLRAIKRGHDKLVDAVIHMSSLGIDQPPYSDNIESTTPGMTAEQSKCNGQQLACVNPQRLVFPSQPAD